MLPDIIITDDSSGKIKNIKYSNQKLEKKKEEKLQERLKEVFFDFYQYVSTFAKNTNVSSGIICTYSDQNYFGPSERVMYVEINSRERLKVVIALSRIRHNLNSVENFTVLHTKKTLFSSFRKKKEIESTLLSLSNSRSYKKERVDVQEMRMYDKDRLKYGYINSVTTLVEKDSFKVYSYKYSEYFQYIVNAIQEYEQVILEDELKKNAQLKANIEIDEEFPEIRI